MTGIDWGFWGVVVAIVSLVVAIGFGVVSVLIPFLLDRRSNAADVTVKGAVDGSGIVLVHITKSGRPTVHVDDVKLLRSGTNSVLPQVWRTSGGDFDIAAGNAEYRCYFQLDGESAVRDGVDVLVRRSSKSVRVTATPSDRFFVVPAELARIEVRAPSTGAEGAQEG
jgi:hypothetical protein